jgi:hypothetical protein
MYIFPTVSSLSMLLISFTIMFDFRFPIYFHSLLSQSLILLISIPLKTISHDTFTLNILIFFSRSGLVHLCNAQVAFSFPSHNHHTLIIFILYCTCLSVLYCTLYHWPTCIIRFVLSEKIICGICENFISKSIIFYATVEDIMH